MLRVLIADDEKKVGELVNALVNWEEMGLSLLVLFKMDSWHMK